MVTYASVNMLARDTGSNPIPDYILNLHTYVNIIYGNE
jgi:hypothetical protein